MSKQNQFPITMVKLKDIIHSHTNPSDRDVVDDLAASIKTHGLLNPITVRPSATQKGKNEIVAGERRFRAYEVNKETEIPAFVRELTDDEALTLQTIENLQREDISPIDEAIQFAMLLKKQKLDWLCSTISKPIKYVQDRLKLNDLTAEGTDYVRKGIIPLGHAIMISKLTVPDQIRCINYCISIYGSEEQTGVTRSDLRDYIEKELTLDMDRAPFDLADATLSTTNGPCSTCPMRTINAKLLFSDMIDDDRCTSRQCYDSKLTTYLDRAKQKTKEEYGKVAVGTAGWNNNEVKVGGKSLKYSETPIKGSTPVVLTKADTITKQGQIGKVVHVVIPPKVEKKAVEKPKQEDWETKQRRVYMEVTFPNIIKAADIYNNEKLDLAVLIRSMIEEQFDNMAYNVAAPLIQLISGMATDPEKSYCQDFNTELLKTWSINDMLPLLMLCDAIEENGQTNWDDVEKAIAPQLAAPKKAASKSPAKKK